MELIDSNVDPLKKEGPTFEKWRNSNIYRSDIEHQK